VIEVTVTTLATTLLGTLDTAEEIGWLDELPATIPVFKSAVLEDETTEGVMLDADDGMIEGAILAAEVETIWLDELLTGAAEVAEDPAFELVVGL
jgi:hypothetical protein